MAVSPIGKNEAVQNNLKSTESSTRKQENNGAAFQDTLNSFISEINELQTKAGNSIDKLKTDKIENVHEVMAAMSKAEKSYKYMMETRNKLMETYKEVLKKT